MASKDVEMSGKNNPGNSMNDKRDYEVEECVSLLHTMSELLPGGQAQTASRVSITSMVLKGKSCCLQVPLPRRRSFILFLGQVLGSAWNWNVLRGGYRCLA